jgi:hypothetical protein
LQERVRRVVLHLLADQWRHECDANISIIARDLSSARFIGARSASPASSPIAGLARRLLHPLPKPNPVHDWTSHAADAFRYLAMTLDSTVSVRNFSRRLEYPNLGIV